MTRSELEHQVAALLAASSVPIVRERKGRQETDDLRPSVLALAVADGPRPDRAERASGRRRSAWWPNWPPNRGACDPSSW